MGKVISFANQKGGSGKTTLSANLAVLWSNSGYKVAVIDADAQNSLTYWLEARKKYYGENYQDVSARVPSIENARRYLGWEPSTDMQTSLKKTLSFYFSDEK